ncbi:MAG: hypothetical protein M3Y59_24140 [Myxococcota bacterium]|nr:hypothetical protein [Myxococcota bacterium]
MVRPALVLLLLSGCVPMYVPASVHAPMLERAGDVHLAVSGGTQGAQLNGAVAVTDFLAVRASAQGYAAGDSASTTSGNRGYGNFVSGGAGVGLFHGGNPSRDVDSGSGLRASVNLELHGGRSGGGGEFRVTLPSSTVNAFSGTFFRPVLQGDVGYEWEFFALGVAARLSSMQFMHDADSDFANESASMLTAEPFAFARVGSGNLKFELQAGGVLPVGTSGNVGVPLLVVLSGGLIIDL